jgi:glutaminase
MGGQKFKTASRSTFLAETLKNFCVFEFMDLTQTWRKVCAIGGCLLDFADI